MRIVYPLLGAALIALGLPAHANLLTFDATLTGAGENPANASPAVGSLVATLDDVTDLFTIDETFSGLTAPAAAAHIHCCAGPGVNAPVVLNFVGAGFPTGSTAGTFNHTFDLTTALAGISVSSFLTALEAGTTYANIHDAVYPGGEIRGQLIRVPEPATFSLLLFGVGAMAIARSRKKERAS
jgi:hypothetical protein